MMSLFAPFLWYLLAASLCLGYPQVRAPFSTYQKQFTGVNICGFEFGCNNQGSCNLSGVDPPVRGIPPTYSENLTNDGAAQMGHFVHVDGLNMFRLPVSWQYLTNSTLGGPLNPTNFGYYDRLVQSCLQTGAHCQIDLHNYARWEGAVIGEPKGPSNEAFADIWAQLAMKYASHKTVWFGLMNEAHNMESADGWAASVQAAVTAIRNAGAITQYISLPGTSFQSAGALMYDGSGAALAKVTNPDNSTTRLVFDVHLYLNEYGNGDTSECITNGTAEAWDPLAAWLRKTGRQALVSETGGGDTSSCKEFVCQELDYLRSNSDVFLGYVMWAAGSFRPSYVLSLTPVTMDESWEDTELMTACVAR